MASRGTAVVGIDIGTLDSIIAYVGKAMVDIVQNEVSNRKTPTMVGFNDRERLLGDAANTVAKSNFKNTVRNFRHIVGPQKFCEEQIKKEEFWGLASSTDGPEGSIAFKVNYKGEEMTYTASQVLAMYLTKMRDTAENWCQAKVYDVVISVPSYFNDFQRQAMLDAASIAGLNCLRLMNESTATALAYGIYRTWDPEKPTITAFGHMGHSSFSLCIATFVPGRLEILAEEVDTDCAGRDMDRVLMEHFAAEFKKKYGCDPLSSKKAKLKLEDACQKTKKVLSANDQAPIGIECLMEDEDLSSKISRDEFEALCAPLQARCEATILRAIEKAGMKDFEKDDFTYVEIVGGASRVPWFKNTMSKCFKEKELSTTLNADECVARGCALQAAILSPAYKVREFKVEDRITKGVKLVWEGTAKDAVEADKDGDVAMEDKEGDEPSASQSEAPTTKDMDVFKGFEDKMDCRRYISWYRKGPFELQAQYGTGESQFAGTEIGRYKVEMPVSEEKKKIKIEAKLNVHGIFAIENAFVVETEEYEEIVKEKREIVEEEKTEEEKAKDGDAPMPDAAADANGEKGNGASGEEEEKKKDGKEGEKSPKKDEKKEEKKKPKYEWVEVKKPKKRTKKTNVPVVAHLKPGMPADILGKFTDIETKLISDTREAKENDDRRNELETYVYAMREKVVSDSGAWAEYMKKSDREEFGTKLQAGEDWLYDHFEATTVELIEKLQELKDVGNPVQTRFEKRQAVQEYQVKFEKSITEIRALAGNPSEEYVHIDSDKKQNVLSGADDLEAWFGGAKAADMSKPKYETSDLKLDDMKNKLSDLKKLCKTVMSEPKPAPPPAPVEEEKTAEEGTADDVAAAANGTKTESKEGEHGAAEGEEGEKKEGEVSKEGDAEKEAADAAEDAEMKDAVPSTEATGDEAAPEEAGGMQVD